MDTWAVLRNGHAGHFQKFRIGTFSEMDAQAACRNGHAGRFQKWTRGPFSGMDMCAVFRNGHLGRFQKWTPGSIPWQRHEQLLRGASLRDCARLKLQKMPHTTAWMAVTPNEGLGQKMDGSEYRYLAKWWLGRRLFEGRNVACPCCEKTMDFYGDHLVSCEFNQPVARHNALRDALADALKEVGIACQKEVAIGGARHPADLALPNLDQRWPTAIDLVVHHQGW